jgi:multiple sugar transport system permease protein
VKFVGLANYAHAVSDNEAIFAFGRTAYFTALHVPLSVILAVAIAVMLNQAVPGRGAFRSIFYLPTIVPIVATVWVWKIFLDQNFGLLNAAIGLVLPNLAVHWLVDYPTYVLIVLTLWTGVGGGMVIALAGLQGVPNELKEAAQIDGANRWRVFLGVTLPLLTPVIFFQVLLGIIGSLQVLVTPLLLAGASLSAMPPHDNYFYLIHVYIQVFANQRFGYGTALLWLLFVIIVILSAVVFRSSRYWVYYEAETEGGKG